MPDANPATKPVSDSVATAAAELHKRHEFKAAVRRLLEEQARSMCCNPGCKQPTRATSYDDQRSVNIGTAAHLHAASPNGPRYDAKMTQDEREAHTNGIWLCRNCGTLVDDDEGGFPVEVLLKWKEDALQERRDAVVSPAQKIAPTVGHAPASPLATNNDIARYHEFIRAFPTATGLIGALRAFDAAASFDRHLFNVVDDLVHEWTTPERAFSNTTVQAALRQLTKAASAFLQYGAFNTFPSKNSAGVQEVPSEWQDTNPERFNKTVKALNDLADGIMSTHQALIVTARRELGI